MQTRIPNDQAVYAQNEVGMSLSSSQTSYGSVRLITSRFGTNVRRENKFTIDDYMNQCLPLWGQRLCQQGASSADIYRFGCNLKGM